MSHADARTAFDHVVLTLYPRAPVMLEFLRKLKQRFGGKAIREVRFQVGEGGKNPSRYGQRIVILRTQRGSELLIGAFMVSSSFSRNCGAKFGKTLRVPTTTDRVDARISRIEAERIFGT
jgi:hypothetical protein